MNHIRTIGRLSLVLALSASLAACGINTIPAQDEAVKAQWGEVQNQYQRRADLIPNLVATVKGYAAQEAKVLTDVTQARASATQVSVDASTITDDAKFREFQAAQDRLTGVLGRLMMIQENYPDLKSNQNFLALQAQLEGTENRIAIARRDYNQAAQRYNTTLRSFPQNIWAATVHRGQEPANLFSASAQAQTAPTVSFEPTPPAPSGPPTAVPQAAPPAAPK